MVPSLLLHTYSSQERRRATNKRKFKFANRRTSSCRGKLACALGKKGETMTACPDASTPLPHFLPKYLLVIEESAWDAGQAGIHKDEVGGQWQSYSHTLVWTGGLPHWEAAPSPQASSL